MIFKIQTARHRFKRFDSLTRITEDQDGGAVYWRITEDQDWRAVL